MLKGNKYNGEKKQQRMRDAWGQGPGCHFK